MISSLSFLYLRSCDGDSLGPAGALELVGDVLVLQLAQLLVAVGDLVEGLDHRGFSSASMAASDIVLELVVVHVVVAFRRAFAGGGRQASNASVAERRGGRRPQAARNSFGALGHSFAIAVGGAISAGFMLFLASGPA
jgi:hypothetical protein